jgi:hypothetical protein
MAAFFLVLVTSPANADDVLVNEGAKKVLNQVLKSSLE